MVTDERDQLTFDETQVKRIIEAASAIEARQGDRVTRTELESIAAELGIGRDAVAQAVEQMREDVLGSSASGDVSLRASGSAFVVRVAAMFGILVAVLLFVALVLRMFVPGRP